MTRPPPRGDVPPGAVDYMQRGLLVPYTHVLGGGRYGGALPGPRGDRVIAKGRVWEWMDFCCARPSCPCVEVVLVFAALDASDQSFSVQVPLDSGDTRYRDPTRDAQAVFAA